MELLGLEMEKPDPERDAPYALNWFSSPSGKQTLLRGVGKAVMARR